MGGRGRWEDKEKREKVRGTEREGALADGENQEMLTCIFLPGFIFGIFKMFCLQAFARLQSKRVVVCVCIATHHLNKDL